MYLTEHTSKVYLKQNHWQVYSAFFYISNEIKPNQVIAWDEGPSVLYAAQPDVPEDEEEVTASNNWQPK